MHKLSLQRYASKVRADGVGASLVYRFCVKMFMRWLYCLPQSPEVSRSHGAMRRLDEGFPSAAAWSGSSEEPGTQT